MINAMSYESFGIKVGNLSELEWKEVTKQTQDGQTWIVREEGGAGHIFRVDLSGRQRQGAPEGTVPIQRADFPTPEEVRKAAAIAIDRHTICEAWHSIEKGKECPVQVTSFDLYKAAGSL